MQDILSEAARHNPYWSRLLKAHLQLQAPFSCAVWPMNPVNEVQLLLQILNLYSRRNIQVLNTHVNASLEDRSP